ncbi:MAG: hypothetical protein NPIRA02_16810 [Nitrospirales bacterium]|nr:MAG: hypothetical protein NPIRA02_16810 [Nitrospirales bacterium]
MPVNMLKKKGARMSLREAQDRVEKLRNLMQSNNPHEAALAASRLHVFDVETARYPKQDPIPSEGEERVNMKRSTVIIDVLDDMPERLHQDLGVVEVEQPPKQKKVNWEALHAELRDRAQQIGADALVNIHLKGTIQQRVLCATALRYLTPVEIDAIQQETKYEDDEKAYWEEQKERRDESFAPGID